MRTWLVEFSRFFTCYGHARRYVRYGGCNRHR